MESLIQEESMTSYRNFFATWEATEPPPVQTPAYIEIKNKYDDWLKPVLQDIPLSKDSDLGSNQLLENYMVNVFPVQLQDSKIQNQSQSTQTRTENNNYIISYFMNKGLTENQAKGIYGNLMQESGGDIDAMSKDGHKSYGLAQWTGDRKRKLFKMYGDRPNLKQQLDFLWWELNNTERAALSALKQTSTVYEATKVFMNKFERPHKDYANFARRLKYANSAITNR